MPDNAEYLRYKRSRFTARLPIDRRYTPSHFWAQEVRDGVWRVGFTRFAKRMLGDLVEFGFDVKQGDDVQVGQVIGWVEAFKAVADLYCIVDGAYVGHNTKLDTQPDLVDKDADGEGWLYEVTGTPDDSCVNAEGYARILDAQIDKMLGENPALAEAQLDEDDNC